MPEADPVHKVTIIPRGPSLGLTSWLPEEDRHSIAKKYCLAMLRVAMGGRAAEEIIFGEFTSGAAGDLQMATNQAHSMVCEWGMSDLGPVAYTGGREVFLGRDLGREREFSESTAAEIDKVIRQMLDAAYEETKSLLIKHRDILDAITEALVERETLDGAELDEIIIKVGGEGILPEREEVKEPVKRPVSQPKPAEAKEEPKGIDEVPPPGDVVPGTA